MMDTTSPDFTFTTAEPPLEDAVSRELTDLWEGTFETSYDAFRGVLAGEEKSANRDIIYYARAGSRLVGSSHLVYPRAKPEVGGLGEVATLPEYRRRGLAFELCARARDEFIKQGGKALFLGTIESAAARLYRRLGWRKLAGANVMCLVTEHESPEAFLVDYYRKTGPARIVQGDAAMRIPLIPLIVAPHDWHVLDANPNLFSTRYTVQNSCMGLYPRYAALTRDGHGAWFSALTEDGRVVGLSSVRLDGGGGAQVDAFTHHGFGVAWLELVSQAITWATRNGATGLFALNAEQDEQKRSLFEDLGFQVGDPSTLETGEAQVACRCLNKRVG